MNLDTVKIEQDVKVGNAIFRKGISVKTVLGAARRAFERRFDTEPILVQPEVMTFEQINGVHALTTQSGRQFVPVEAYYDIVREMAQMRQHQVEYPVPSFQQRVSNWVLACLGVQSKADRVERDYRFAEEAIELIQARGNLTKEDITRVADSVYAKPPGDVFQEVGGLMTTLGALCETAKDRDGHQIDMMEAGEMELTRIWGDMPKIREKQKTKVRQGIILPPQSRVEREPTPRLYVD
jgi:hypothetical protein